MQPQRYSAACDFSFVSYSIVEFIYLWVIFSRFLYTPTLNAPAGCYVSFFFCPEKTKQKKPSTPLSRQVPLLNTLRRYDRSTRSMSHRRTIIRRRWWRCIPGRTTIICVNRLSRPALRLYSIFFPHKPKQCEVDLSIKIRFFSYK